MQLQLWLQTAQAANCPGCYVCCVSTEHPFILHPCQLSLLQGDASALETAVAEMGQAAASLVAIERQIGELTQEGVRF